MDRYLALSLAAVILLLPLLACEGDDPTVPPAPTAAVSAIIDGKAYSGDLAPQYPAPPQPLIHDVMASNMSVGIDLWFDLSAPQFIAGSVNDMAYVALELDGVRYFATGPDVGTCTLPVYDDGMVRGQFSATVLELDSGAPLAIAGTFSESPFQDDTFSMTLTVDGASHSCTEGHACFRIESRGTATLDPAFSDTTWAGLEFRIYSVDEQWAQTYDLTSNQAEARLVMGSIGEDSVALAITEGWLTVTAVDSVIAAGTFGCRAQGSAGPPLEITEGRIEVNH